MGLMDSLLGAAQQALAGQQQQQGGGPNWFALITTVLAQSQAQPGSGPGAQAGGLGAILQQLQAGGLGEQLQSWIGTGANQPVSGAQISSALGGDLLARLAAQAGVSHEEASHQLSQHLPQIVDGLTPGGELPDNSSLDALLGQMLGRSGG